ncbi:dihydrolipoyl dehydrogenase [Aerococcus sanguinicola]|uniref:Dihydrolipoyl dehydrogenase n=1 Tax=Aerococcus sanguinicola TaxID=119206 RepID=A0A0X8FAJ8_9LACT|nr:dihydrolipoyl dehydrogenase [Aerococcus sanguinicola]AMB93628.1 dihydrolipoamide dehydrogenase [Aerococcus sanguinicola]
MVVGAMAIELDTVVIGSGPGGYVAAIRAAQKGQKVTVIEREFLGGVCLNVGCIPSKALIQAGHAYHSALEGAEVFGVTTEGTNLDFTKTQDWKDNQVVKKMTDGIGFLFKKNKIDVVWGEAYINNDKELTITGEGDEHQLYTYNNLIVATGSTPIEIPGFKFGGNIVDSTGALAFEEVPEKLLVIGGGVVGSELGSAYANLGSEVTILEGSPQLLPGFEKDMVKVVQKDMKKKGMKVITNGMAKEATDNGDSVTVKYEEKGKEKEITVSKVLVSVGRRPNTAEIGLQAAGVEMDDRGLVKVDEQGRTSVKNIYAIGDIVPGLALAHKASYEGIVAAEAIAGENAIVDYKSMPSIAYTDPELASYGLTEADAKEKGLDVHSFKFPFGGNGRAVSMANADGFVRLVATKDNNIIVGGQVVGPNASDAAAEIGLAIESGMTAEDIALTVHGHPTLNEAIKDCAEGLLGQAIHA